MCLSAARARSRLSFRGFCRFQDPVESLRSPPGLRPVGTRQTSKQAGDSPKTATRPESPLRLTLRGLSLRLTSTFLRNTSACTLYRVKLRKFCSTECAGQAASRKILVRS